MAKITKVSELQNPKFVKPIALEYEESGEIKQWEAVLSHDSVSILLYNESRDAFVVVKQLRPAVLNATKKDGYMYELCAGIIDKELTPKEIAREEVLEECGYDIPLECIEEVTTFFTSVGISGASQRLYYATIDDNMIVNSGGGLAEESIEVIYIPRAEAKAFLFDASFQKTPGMMFAFYWFFDNWRGGQPLGL